MSVAAFREQISWLSGHGFDFVSLSFLLQSIQTRDYRILTKKVVMTFDDGYQDFVANALPILLDHRATATVFLVTDMLGKRVSWREYGTDVQLMSEDEVRYIKAKGISLGSHTSTHANLTILDNEDLHRQLSDSRYRLTLLGESFYAFSYPWGQWSSQVVNAVKASGYKCAVIVGGDMRPDKTDIYCLPRITMTGNMDLKAFRSLFARPVVKRARKVSRILKKYI
ncbi:MAG TPA: polysaccharide deacetylase family protein [Syntrophales bacterium]|nr:polysaccharide deacetylase family protein [Syntrophales bacterium]HQM28619.1 polysaccharide deacetylase family protein [Syntrophales bacterium]